MELTFTAKSKGEQIYLTDEDFLSVGVVSTKDIGLKRTVKGQVFIFIKMEITLMVNGKFMTIILILPSCLISMKLKLLRIREEIIKSSLNQVKFLSQTKIKLNRQRYR